MQIKYKKPDKPEKGVDYYARFLRDRIQEGFVFAKEHMLSILQCSPGFVQTLQQSVDYMHVSVDYFRAGASPELAQDLNIDIGVIPPQQSVLIYYNEQQLHDFLLTVPQYTRQTRFIPLEVAFRHDPQKMAGYQEHKDAIAALYAQAKDLREHNRAGLDSGAALDRALKDLDKQIEQKSIEKGFYCGRVCPEHARAMNFKCRTGDDVKAVEVDPFEWWKCNGFFAARRSPYSCGELMYRAAFSGGYIKICFGNRKTFFCPPQDVPHGRGEILLVTACADFPD